MCDPLILGSGLPNLNFRNQDIFLKNQELIRRFFPKTQEKNQEIYFLYQTKTRKHRICFSWRSKTVTFATVCNFFLAMLRSGQEGRRLKKVFHPRWYKFFFCQEKRMKKPFWTSYFLTKNINFSRQKNRAKRLFWLNKIMRAACF